MLCLHPCVRIPHPRPPKSSVWHRAWRSTPCCACFPPCALEAEGSFIRTLKWLLMVPWLQPSRGLEWLGRAVVLPNRSPGAWPGQGLGLMVFTKLLPSCSLRKGSQSRSLWSCSDLEGRYWPGFWNGQSPPGKTGGGRRWGGALSAEGRIRSLAQ